MPPVNFKIRELHSELETILRQVPSFSGHAFSIFSVDNLQQQAGNIGWPLAGVMYEGCSPAEDKQGGTPQSSPRGRGDFGVAMLDVQYSIVIGVQYGFSGTMGDADSDTKLYAFSLLDDVRAAVLGFKGVNTRPWRFIGEKPELEASTDTEVYYSQVWRTTVPQSGNTTL